MSKMEVKPQSAWLPLTPRGVATFASATTGRLWLVQFVFALLAAFVVGLITQTQLFPTVTQAILQLPDRGEIRSQRLNWQGPSPQLLAEGSVLGVIVDLDHAGDLRPSSDVQVEFGRDDFRIRSLFGIMDGRYPNGWVISFGRLELEPKWGAWRPAFLAGAVAGTIAWLMVTWGLLALLYSPLVLAVGFFVNRKLNLAVAWRLCGASLMPGSLVMTAALVVYAVGLLDLVGLLFAFGLHLALGLAYLFLSLFFVRAVEQKENPFAPKSGS